MTMYDIINQRGTAAQQIAAAQISNIIRRAIIAAHYKNVDCMYDHIAELNTYICALRMGVAMAGGNVDEMALSVEEWDKITTYIHKVYEMEMKIK